MLLESREQTNKYSGNKISRELSTVPFGLVCNEEKASQAASALSRNVGILLLQ
jgi:hypothetical protein